MTDTIKSVWQEDAEPLIPGYRTGEYRIAWREYRVHKITPKRIYLASDFYVDREALERDGQVERPSEPYRPYCLTPGDGPKIPAPPLAPRYYTEYSDHCFVCDAFLDAKPMNTINDSVVGPVAWNRIVNPDLRELSMCRQCWERKQPTDERP